MRTVYAPVMDSACPVCSSPLLSTGIDVEPRGSSATPTKVDPRLIPDDEAMRLEAVRRYEILDTPRDGSFDRVTSLAAKIFGVPIASVTVVDSDRIWFKSAFGIDADQIGRDPGLCASAILSDDITLVPDARRDPQALNNPLVLGELGLRFYAGAPLKTADGYNLGTLNIIDREPRELSEVEQSILLDLAQIVVDELELRLAARHLYQDLGVPILR